MRTIYSKIYLEYPNSVIFDSVNSSSSPLSKDINLPNFYTIIRSRFFNCFQRLKALDPMLEMLFGFKNMKNVNQKIEKIEKIDAKIS